MFDSRLHVMILAHTALAQMLNSRKSNIMLLLPSDPSKNLTRYVCNLNMTINVCNEPQTLKKKGFVIFCKHYRYKQNATSTYDMEQL